jgi:hypothetical protein
LQLLKLNWNDDFDILEISDIRRYTRAIQTVLSSVHTPLQTSMFHVFTDAEKVRGGNAIFKAGTTTLTTVTLFTNDGSGKMYSHNA